MKFQRLVLLGLAGVTALTMSACDGGYSWSAQSDGNPKPATAGEAEVAASKSAEPPKRLKVTKLDGWMPFVTNDTGRTIYRFDNDSANPSKSTCFDACAKTWEPVLAPNGQVEVIGDGIDESEVDLIDRPEGKQVTLAGWPLYYYKDDKKLGETAGHGMNDKWFAIAPDGKKSCKESDW